MSLSAMVAVLSGAYGDMVLFKARRGGFNARGPHCVQRLPEGNDGLLKKGRGVNIRAQFISITDGCIHKRQTWAGEVCKTVVRMASETGVGKLREIHT
jgi:hypothetical protein